MRATRLISLLFIVHLAHQVFADGASGQQVGSISETSLTQAVQRSWQTEDGLPQNTIAAIEQSPDGYMWFGTEEGLVRFNGTEFKVFDEGNTGAFASNQSIRALEMRIDSSLWIGTDGGGLVIYRDGLFESSSSEPSTGPRQIITLFEDRAGTLWIGTFDDGLWMLRPGQRSPSRVFGETTVQSLTEDSIGNLYAATSEGIVRINVRGERELFGSPSSRLKAIRRVFVDRLDRIWYASLDGVHRMDDPIVEQEITTTPGLSFLQDSQGLIWIGLDGAGLVRMGETQESLSTRNGLTHDRIVSLFEDREGNIWVGTEGGGLVQLSNGDFVTYGVQEGLASEMILTVAASKDGDVWAGTEGGGLYRFRDGEIKHFGQAEGLSDDIITSLAIGPDGSTWVGTYSGGLNQISRRGVISHTGEREGLPPGVVGAIAVSRDGSVWVGTDGGLTRLVGGTTTTLTTEDGLGSNYLTALTEDQDGDLWIGTYAGLFVYDGKTIREAERQPDNTILSIVEDAVGALWITTLHNGVFIKYGDDWYQFSRRHGLPSNSIYQVVFDEVGGVWLTSNKGLFTGDRVEILNAAREDSVVNLVTKTSSDGLRSTEFNGGVQPAGTVDGDGRMWFPSIKGLATINPERLDIEEVDPNIVVEQVAINGEDGTDQFLSGRLSLQPGQRKIEISAAAITFASPERVVIKYQLVGQDNTWGQVSPGQKITYTNLVPGTYTLRLQAASSDGLVPLGTEQTIEVVLAPFLWQRPIFWVVVLIASVFLIMAMHRIRIRAVMRAQRIKNLELEKVVVQRTQELRQLNENLAEKVEEQVKTHMSERVKFENKLIDARDRAMESDRLKSTIMTNLGHEFRTPITSILGFTEIIAEKLTGEDLEFTDYITTSAQRLLDTVTSLMNLSELEAKAVRHAVAPVAVCEIVNNAAEEFKKAALAKGLKFQVVCPPNPIIATLDPQLLHKSVTAVLNNAVKYTNDGEVEVVITESSGTISISIRDTGIGISETFMPELFSAFKQESYGETRQYEGCGLGLTVAHRLIDIMGGDIKVESSIGSGSTFTLVVPSRQAEPTDQSEPNRGNVAEAA